MSLFGGSRKETKNTYAPAYANVRKGLSEYERKKNVTANGFWGKVVSDLVKCGSIYLKSLGADLW